MTASSLHAYSRIGCLLGTLAACGGITGAGGSGDGGADAPSVGTGADVDSADGGPRDAPSDVTFDVWCETGQAGGQQAVSICAQYFALLTSCFQHDYGSYTCSDPLLPKTDADVARIEALCAFYLRGTGHVCQ